MNVWCWVTESSVLRSETGGILHCRMAYILATLSFTVCVFGNRAYSLPCPRFTWRAKCCVASSSVCPRCVQVSEKTDWIPGGDDLGDVRSKNLFMRRREHNKSLEKNLDFIPWLLPKEHHKFSKKKKKEKAKWQDQNYFWVNESWNWFTADGGKLFQLIQILWFWSADLNLEFQL